MQLEPEPPEAAAACGEGLPVVRRFAADLAARGVELGLIGPAEPSRLWSRHLVNSAVLAPLLPQGSRVADVGSGAGLPGLVVAAVRPDLALTLIEPMERRVAWLEEEAARLGLGNVTVVRARAEEYRGEPFDVVTARAVGALAKLLPLVAPLAGPGGRLALLKGASVDAEVARAEKVIRRLRLHDARVETVGSGMASAETRVFVATLPV
ncbi:16S rRNA (guanine(527)-N(7))-methyltransferase RsmG [Amnibacterium sp. CER49]|uniref:16S rRNA (guanine(527)-N(7))-methyltransferase RsmG n=1 Tax=Amnibacterium sp. CER49 TaxID=3039161 RepID=UPI00244B93A1|nr:16S rRNA (guanine(527)-N(7))-methyltransferase RsmG [Amnibacterium sp. CER49]MDH2443630.1 16S rRNA (guanine(527)-N(7))-methyltransferase RsmG [Amnibacterium sp. CER49]